MKLFKKKDKNIEAEETLAKNAESAKTAADKTMMEAGVRREHRKEYVDMIAATLILQGYLDRQAMKKKED